MQLIRNPLIIALDVDSVDEANHIIDQTADFAGAFKVGPRLLLRAGAAWIEKIIPAAPCFVDFKFFDIPSTMLAAVNTCFEAGATLVTVHALAGLEALKQLAELEKKCQSERPFKILGVTLLTSFQQSNLPSPLGQLSAQDIVLKLTQDLQNSGFSGLVCSPHEVKEVRKKFGEQAFLVTPGVRRSEDSNQDQARVMTPKEAIQAGSSALVVGRPILEAKDRRLAAETFLQEIKGER